MMMKPKTLATLASLSLGAALVVACTTQIEYVYVAVSPDAAGDSGSDTGSEVDLSDAGACDWVKDDNGLSGSDVGVIEFDQFSPMIVWIGAGNQTFRSDDEGKTFKKIGDFPGVVSAIVIPRGQSSAVFAATAQGIYRTDDSGKTWRLHSLGGESVLGLQVDPSDARRMVATLLHRVLFSSDEGLNWNDHNGGLPTLIEPRAVSIHPKTGEIALLAYDPSAANGSKPVSLYLSEYVGSWQKAASFSEALSLARCPSDPNVLLLAALYDGYQRSNDGGRTFAPVSPDPKIVANWGWFASSSNCDDFYAGALYANGLFRISNKGQSVVGPLSTGFPYTNKQPQVLGVSPTNGLHLVGGGSGVLVRSENGGDQWTEVPGTYNLAFRKLAAGIDGTLWASSWGSGQWMRRPGEPFKLVQDKAQFGFTVAPHPTKGDTALFGNWSQAEVVSGNTITYSNLAKNVLSLAHDPTDPSHVLAAAQLGGLFESLDGGATWTSKGQGLPTEITDEVPGNGYADAIAFSLANPNRVVLGTVGKGAFVSSDRGATWTSISSPEMGPTLTLLTATTDGFYAPVSAHGIFFSSDGVSWSRVDSTFPALTFSDVAVDGTTVFVATNEGVLSYAPASPTWKNVGKSCVTHPGKITLATRDGQKRLYATFPEGVYFTPAP